MKKLSMLALLAIVTCGNAMFAMDSDRPAVYQVLDTVIEQNKSGRFAFNWPPIFAMLDRMEGVINVNEYRLPTGYTLLDEAIVQKNLLAVQTLLKQYHANPNITVDVASPLSTAIFLEDRPIANLLRSYGATE